MTQQQAPSFWDCDAPGCSQSDMGIEYEPPMGWGVLIYENKDYDICIHCMAQVGKALDIGNS